MTKLVFLQTLPQNLSIVSRGHICAGLIAFALLALLGGCAERKPETVVGTVNALYNDGLDQLQSQDLRTAIATFEDLERQHPYSGWATRAQLMAIYANYQNEDYLEAIAGAERFARLHPGHPNLAYVLYLKGMSSYVQISDITRDQGHTEAALKDFQELVRRFPNSDYAQDASLKITLCRDHLAGKELAVGRWYLGQKRYVAAIKRFQQVVQNYETTGQVPEALYRLTEAYIALGVGDEAQRYAAVLGYNYPESDWYTDAYRLLTQADYVTPEQKDGWAQRVYQGVQGIF